MKLWKPSQLLAWQIQFHILKIRICDFLNLFGFLSLLIVFHSVMFCKLYFPRSFWIHFLKADFVVSKFNFYFIPIAALNRYLSYSHDSLVFKCPKALFNWNSPFLEQICYEFSPSIFLQRSCLMWSSENRKWFSLLLSVSPPPC